MRTILINRLTSPLLALINESDSIGSNNASKAFKDYILKFVYLICELFGQTKRLQMKSSSGGGNDLMHISRSTGGETNGSSEFTVLTKGSLSTAIRRFVDWGYDLEHFLNVSSICHMYDKFILNIVCFFLCRQHTQR